MVRAVARYEACILTLLVVLRKNAVQQEETMSASGDATGFDLYRRWCSAELARKTRLANIKRCCGMRTSPPAKILHFGKTLGNRCDAHHSGQRRIISSPVSSGRTHYSPQLDEGNLAPWLALRLSATHECTLSYSKR